jgi:Uncharacterised nucleotidyltransferase
LKAVIAPNQFLSVNNSYVRLAWFLSPRKTQGRIDEVKQLAAEGRIDWNDLLLQANVQVCTPLWYVQLKRDGLLGLLPQELQDYLHQLHQANIVRNAALRRGMEELLNFFGQRGIVPLLLKGAATFCDDLYGDPGARVMGDLDILVRAEEVETAHQILLELGYREIPNPGIVFDNIGTDERHHHLPRYFKPKTPVVVEIHFKVSYGRSGGVLAVDEAWKNTRPAILFGTAVILLNPNWRLLHNSVHALLPHREFIRGDISLSHLAEFAHLGRRYARQIDWTVWYKTATRHKLKTEMALYRQLAVELMSVDMEEIDCQTILISFHQWRILTVMQSQGRQQPTRKPFLPTLYYYFNLPRWVWDNVCYIEGEGKTLQRLFFLLKKGVSARSWMKIGM